MATSIKIDDALTQEALASWAAYQKTGRHLTGQEVRVWLKSWGTKKEAVAPECHE